MLWKPFPHPFLSFQLVEEIMNNVEEPSESQQLTLPINEPPSSAQRKASEKPEEENKKTVRQAKKPKLLKVVISRPKVSAKMKSFKCADCGKSFKEKSSFLRHLKIHKGETPHKCVTCGKTFSKKSSLVIHQRTHSEEKCFTCQECGKTFGQRSTLLVHHKSHIQKRINIAKNGSYASKNTNHGKKQSEEKPYGCLECKKTFVLHKNFIKHQQLHVREVPRGPEMGIINLFHCLLYKCCSNWQRFLAWTFKFSNN